MTEINVKLLDTGKNFILVSADTSTEIEYGQLAISIVNADYDDIYNLIADFIKSNRVLKLAMDLQNSSNDELASGTIKPEILNIILKELYAPIYEYVAKEYLNEQQAVIITLLIMADIRSRLTKATIDLDNPDYYIPLIYSNKELHTFITQLLLKKDTSSFCSLQDKINSIPISSSVFINNQGQALQAYTITDMFDYLLLDILKYLNGIKSVNKCACCGKLFYPKYRNSEKYCDFSRKTKKQSCKEYMKRHNTNEFQKVRDKARAYQSSRIRHDSTTKQYDKFFLENLYYDWSQDLSIKYSEYVSKNDLDGLKKWIEDTKFTAKKLKEEWEKNKQV